MAFTVKLSHMAKDWYWTAAIPLSALPLEAEAWPGLVEQAIGSPPFLAAQELDDAIEFNFEPEAEPAILAAKMHEIDEGLDPARIVWRKTEVKPWLEAYWNKLAPLRVGQRLLIIPREDQPVELDGRLPIYLEPGMAFGTGDHFTTNYCLARLEWAAAAYASDIRVLDLGTGSGASLEGGRLRQPPSPPEVNSDGSPPAPRPPGVEVCAAEKSGPRVLDLGTGSGILSIGAWRLGLRNLEAVDVDPLSIDEATKNFLRNEIPAGAIKLLPGSIHTCTGMYDLIVANLFADLLRAIEPELRGRLRPGGAAIFSGISEENLAKVESSFTPARGWKEIHRDRGTGWVGLTYQRT